MILKFLLTILLILPLVSFSQNDQAKLANEYYQQGDLEKARSIYEDLDNKKSAIPLIHANYLQLLIDAQDYKAVEKYLSRVDRWYANNLQYKTDIVNFYHITGQQSEKSKYLNELRKSFQENQYQLSTLAQNFANRKLYEEALEFYEFARKANGRPSSFALDVAAIYRIRDEKAKMTQEYINYAEGNPANISYVKNLFQNILTEPEDQEFLEETLISKIQQFPNETLYSDLLIWLELQRKNFYGAFIQARALDRRNESPGDQTMRIARIAYDNESWDDAITIFKYVQDNYPNTYNYAQARRLYIRSKENKVKNTFPIDKAAIKSLASEYQVLYNELGANPTTLEALRNKAQLHAFYLGEFDHAIKILEQITEDRRAPRKLLAEAKLDLGDIYLLIGEPWESTLLYSQVEKANKESPMGYAAKLRNARLNYFTGNFSLAKSHLDILKLATTRTISNDAIALSLLISDNTAFDTTDVVMQKFARIELLIFQNKYVAAEDSLLLLLEEYPGHSITDESYWLLSKIALTAGQYEKAITYLDKITTGFSYDILADDAFYQKGVILQKYLNQDNEALDIFTEFLKLHPGSIFAPEARMRIRNLRGDLIN